MSDQEEAARILRDIYNSFGLEALERPEASALWPLIIDGRLLFDASKDLVEYRLEKSIELKNGEKQEVITFREASGSELEYIRKDILVGGDERVSLGSFVSMTLRILVKISGLATGIVDRVKARDIDALRNVFLELGFFVR
jgi:hypothetical protein